MWETGPDFSGKRSGWEMRKESLQIQNQMILDVSKLLFVGFSWGREGIGRYGEFTFDGLNIFQMSRHMTGMIG